MLYAKEKGWAEVPSNSIFDAILVLHRTVGKNKFQKYLSHFGGFRINKDRVIKIGSRAALNDLYPVMKIDEKGKMLFLAVEDPSNARYSAWIQAMA